MIESVRHAQPRLEVIPAVDIRGGRCVQLVQGDFRRETAYADDPVAMACHWQDQGATRVHVVDLDGARDGVRANAEIVRRLLGTLRVPVQVGGGIRSIETARALLADGADRVIVGTAAVEGAERLSDWLQALGPDHFLIAVDARAGKILTHGWQASSQLDVSAFCHSLAQQGVRRVLYTDVERDGTLVGPNIETTRELARTLCVLASGGISTADHLRALAQAGAEGAIIGTALYDGRLGLADARAAAELQRGAPERSSAC